MWMELTESQEMERFARHSGQQGQLASPALHIKAIVVSQTVEASRERMKHGVKKPE